MSDQKPAAYRPASFISCPSPKGELSPRALERRLKRYFLKQEHRFFASVTPGFERILSQEIQGLPDAANIRRDHGGVRFSSPLSLVYDANLRLRTAGRVMIRIAGFSCKSYPELFNRALRMAWELYLGMSPSLEIKASAVHSKLHHTGNIEKTLFDAVTEYYKRFGQKVSEGEGISLRVRFSDDYCMISLDTSGQHLHLRGTKPFSTQAPLRSTLASALLTLSNIEKYKSILDPCCGSGTFLTEASCISCGLFPGRSRSFAFENLPFYNEAKFRKRLELEKAEKARLVLFGWDNNPSAVSAARKNMTLLNPPCAWSVLRRDALHQSLPGGLRGLIISNLPYGRKTGKSRTLPGFYQGLASNLSASFQGWDALFVGKSEKLLSLLPVKVENSLEFSNGGLKVRAITGKIS